VGLFNNVHAITSSLWLCLPFRTLSWFYQCWRKTLYEAVIDFEFFSALSPRCYRSSQERVGGDLVRPGVARVALTDKVFF